MSTKLLFPGALVLVALGVCAVRGQDIPTSPRPDETTQGGQIPGVGVPPIAPPPTTAGPGLLSPWMNYARPCCCGPVGGDGPIFEELFFRTGASVPLGGGNARFFGHTLETGWDVEGGARSVFYDPHMDSAWDITMSVSNILNRGQHSDITVPYNLLIAGATNPITGQPGTPTQMTIPISVRELNRTFANLGFGKEWYWDVPASVCAATRCRVGVDVGGRFGSAKLETHETTHKEDVISGVWVAGHADLERSCGCCTFLYGLRLEWAYTWTDILQEQNPGDVQELNFLVEFGVRF